MSDEREGAGAPDGKRLWLLAVSDSVYATHPLPTSGAVIIGRGPEAGIRIDDASLSPHHARLHLVEGGCELEDLDSAAGSQVGEVRLQPGQRLEVRLNEAMQLGGVTLLVQRRAPQTRRNRLRNHDYFENRVVDESARARRAGPGFVLVHVLSKSALITQVVEESLRDADVVAEYGPGELEMLLVDTDMHGAEQVLRRLGEGVARREIEARFGAAAFGIDGRDPTALAELARDRAHGHPVRETVEADVVIADSRMRALHELVARVATADISVLLLGETGVGKEVIAEMIHQRSQRATKPFVRLNCSALTETLLESELFGHERGAFTGAVQQKLGLLEVANGGVVFLDEIGEMSASTQAKLLRVLDERKVMRVGGVKTFPIDVRVVSATNRDLEQEVVRGAFRQDLLFRINAMTIVIPPLRERTSEIDPLARHFIRTISARTGRPPPRLSVTASEVLQTYGWPGNVRELRNTIERALVFCGDEIMVADLPWEKMTFVGPPPADAKPAEPADDEHARIVAALEACAGNQTDAAQQLGISRRTLIARLEKYNVPRPRKRGTTKA